MRNGGWVIAGVLAFSSLAGCSNDPSRCFTGMTRECGCSTTPLFGTQTCTVEREWGECRCPPPVRDTGVLPDAGLPTRRDAPLPMDAGVVARDVPVDSADSPDVPPECWSLDVTTLAGTSISAEGGTLIARRLDSGIVAMVTLEVHFERGATPGARTVTLTGESYATCEHCVLVSTGCDTPDGPCDTTYLATEGTLNYLMLTETSLDVTLSGVRLFEVVLDPITRTSTFVSPANVCVGHLETRASTCGDGLCLFGETSAVCPEDCS